MPKFDIIKTFVPKYTYRVSSVLSAFDLSIDKIKEHFQGNIDIDNINWNIGLIVGSSGSGKSTIAKELFRDNYIYGYDYNSISVIDDMPKNKSIKDITKVFTSVGFASPPSWLKSYSVLSNGEKMRCDLARAILTENEIIVFDEFTSVVNREVAKTGSFAIQKSIRKLNLKFVAVACHTDIIEWLEPDWIYNTDEQRFFFAKININDPKLNLKYLETKTIKSKFGRPLKSIII